MLYNKFLYGFGLFTYPLFFSFAKPVIYSCHVIFVSLVCSCMLLFGSAYFTFYYFLYDITSFSFKYYNEPFFFKVQFLLAFELYLFWIDIGVIYTIMVLNLSVLNRYACLLIFMSINSNSGFLHIHLIYFY